jgi:uroporphyrinogen-III decarboxylase
MASETLEMLHGVLYGNGLRIGKLSKTGRVFAMMLGKHGDTIPFMGPQCHDHSMTIAKVPARRYYFDANLLVDVQIAVQRWYGFDSYTIVPDAYNFEAEALGAKFIYSDIAMPTVDVNEPYITRDTNLDRLAPLDPSRGRIPMSAEVARLVSEKASGVFAAGFFCSPFSLLCQLMGYPAAIRAVRRDKAYAQELFDFVENDAIFPHVKAQGEKPGVKQSLGADAWAAFPNLTVDLIEEWVLPSARRLAKRGKKELGMTVSAGLAAGDYCEEDPAKFDKQIMFDCWDAASKTLPIGVAFSGMGRTQDWPMEWLQEYSVSRGGLRKLPIYASLNGRFMRDSAPEVIVEKIREWVGILGQGGRVLFFIGNVPADTPAINVHTAIAAVRTIGEYPMPDDLSAIEVGVEEPPPFDEWLKGQPEEEIIMKAREWSPGRSVAA